MDNERTTDFKPYPQTFAYRRLIELAIFAKPEALSNAVVQHCQVLSDSLQIRLYIITLIQTKPVLYILQRAFNVWGRQIAPSKMGVCQNSTMGRAVSLGNNVRLWNHGYRLLLWQNWTLYSHTWCISTRLRNSNHPAMRLHDNLAV